MDKLILSVLRGLNQVSLMQNRQQIMKDRSQRMAERTSKATKPSDDSLLSNLTPGTYHVIVDNNREVRIKKLKEPS